MNTRTRILLMAVAGVCLVCSALVGLASLKGQGSRGFFNPYTLIAQQQTEWLVPIVDVPVYRSSLSPDSYELVDYLVAQGYWQPVAAQSDQPNSTMQMYRWNAQWRDGQSYVYIMLNMHTQRWFEFTQAHPDIAAHYWPLVLETLRSSSNVDLAVMQLADCALNSQSVEAFLACQRDSELNR